MQLKTRASKVLSNQCVEAQSTIVNQFLAAKQRVGEKQSFCAWGQYLDVTGTLDPETASQRGIFGIAAGVQVLALHGVGKHEQTIRQALKLLPGVMEEQPDEEAATYQEYFRAKGDLITTFKVAALLDTALVVAEKDADKRLGVHIRLDAEALRTLARPGEGWPDFHEAGEERSANPHATAVALLVLSSTHPLSNDVFRVCRDAVAWLTPKEPTRMSAATLAMLCVAIDRLDAKVDGTDKLTANVTVAEFRRRCHDELGEWIKSTRPREIRRSLEGTEYQRPYTHQETERPSLDSFRYIFYLPHCLAAWAVLCTPALQRTYRNREFARQVVALLASEICNAGKFVAADRNMVSSVESLWIYRLLEAYRTGGTGEVWSMYCDGGPPC